MKQKRKSQIKLREIVTSRCLTLKRNPQYLTPHQQESLTRSIEHDGFVSPILVVPHGKYYEVISGNHRLLAARAAGLKKIPAAIARLTKRQIKRLTINLNTVHGDPNAELLAPFLTELDDDLLREIHLEDDLLKDLKEFDDILAKRLEKLEVPDILDQSSRSNIPDCKCSKCGKTHVSASRNSK